MSAAHLQPAQIEAHLSDELGASARAEAEAHLAVCSLCRSTLEVAREARAATAPHRNTLLNTLEVPPILQLGGGDEPATKPALSAAQVHFNPFPMGSEDVTARTLRPRALSDLRRGDPVGRYVVVGMVGRGGMADVFVAYDPQLDRRVAIKIVRADSAGRLDDLLRARLVREAQAMARLTHPNVVGVYDAGTVADQVYIAMEFVAGPNLAEWVAEKKRPWREILEKYLGAGRGLAAAHAAGLVHRDFKPENVLVAPDGRPKVTDFGLAHLDGRAPVPVPGGPAAGVNLTSPGAFIGTPAYMAPEQFQGKPVDARSDQFSFCAALYEALYGERPFAGDDVSAIGKALVSGELRSAPRGSPVPHWLRERLERGLAVQPEDRYGSLELLLRELERDPSRTRRRVVERAALVAVACAAIGVAGWVVHRDRTRCAREATSLSASWGPSQASALQARLAGSPDAAALAAQLDGYMQSWRELRTQTCEEAHAGALPAETANLRLRCLDDEGLRVAAAAELVGTPEGVTAARLRERLEGLWSGVSCVRLQLPHHGWLEERKRFSAQLARVDALNEAGAEERAREAATQLQKDAETASSKDVQAAATLALANSYILRGEKLEHALELVRQSIQLAEAAGDDPLVATARVREVRLLASTMNRSDDADRAAPDARAALERAGNPPADSAELDRALGDAAVTRGEKRGVELLERALDEVRTAYGPKTALAVPYLTALGYAKVKVNHDMAGGAQDFLDAAQLNTEAGDPDARDNVILFSNAAFTFVFADQLAQAREAIGNAAELAAKYEASLPVDVAAVYLNRAMVEVEQNQPDAAWVDLAHADKLLQTVDRPPDADEQYYALRSRVELGRGQVPAARDDAEKALEFAGKPPCGEDELADARFALAGALARIDPAHARAVAQQALKHFESTPVPLFARRVRETRALLDSLK